MTYKRYFESGGGNLFLHSILRRKQIDEDSVTKTKLARCLTTLDLTALGIGSTLGAGIYVVAGEVAKATAGPSVIISFLIAALASVLAGLCYAEFGARVPKTGSAYVYSYVSVGELMAFIIGWNLILEYVIGTASVARAWSANFDALINKSISNFFEEHLSMRDSGLAEYPDFFALLITLLLTVILALGVKESSTFNKIFTGVNLCVVTYVIVCGFFKLDVSNWAIPAEDFGNTTSTEVGNGGFFPFGLAGTLSGAGTCFYAFVGFDAIATTGEEVKNPQKAIPISICLCLLACFIAYFGISAVMTLMCPYYLLDKDAPLPFIFNRIGWNIAKYVIAVGAVCGLSTSLLGAMFPLPRVIYAMASDGLIFRFLARINKRFKTPLLATILSGVFAGSMACLFDLKELVDMMSIGTLLAYTLVAVSVLILRGRVEVFARRNLTVGSFGDASTPGSSFIRSNDSTAPLTRNQVSHNADTSNSKVTIREFFRHFLVRRTSYPTCITQFITTCNTYLLLLDVFLISIVFVQEELNRPVIIFFGVLFLAIYVLLTISVAVQPENQSKITFKVPLVPFIPAISMLVNIYLMMKLPMGTWYRFFIWMTCGFLIYFFYGMCHSSEGQPHKDDSSIDLVAKHVASELGKEEDEAREKLIDEPMVSVRDTKSPNNNDDEGNEGKIGIEIY